MIFTIAGPITFAVIFVFFQLSGLNQDIILIHLKDGLKLYH